MTTEFEKSGEPAHESQSESFFEPRTIPKKWDVSAFDSHLTPSRNGNPDQTSETTDPDDTYTVEESESEAVLDPFPQPRTVPGNWDVSDLT
jgi:hypothetical protein